MRSGNDDASQLLGLQIFLLRCGGWQNQRSAGRGQDLGSYRGFFGCIALCHGNRQSVDEKRQVPAGKDLPVYVNCDERHCVYSGGILCMQESLLSRRRPD